MSLHWVFPKIQVPCRLGNQIRKVLGKCSPHGQILLTQPREVVKSPDGEYPTVSYLITAEYYLHIIIFALISNLLSSLAISVSTFPIRTITCRCDKIREKDKSYSANKRREHDILKSIGIEIIITFC